MATDRPVSATYLIHEGELDELQRKLKRLSKAAQRMGLPEFEIAIGKAVFKKMRSSSASPIELVKFHEVSVKGQEPVLGGWRFLAKLDHTEAGNIVSRSHFASSDQPAPLDEKYQTCPPNCDHCNTNRDRNNTYLFQNVADGTIKQVGSSCFKDFDGHGDPMALLAYLDGIAKLNDWANTQEQYLDDDDGAGFGGGPRTSHYEVLPTLEVAIAVIRSAGRYISTSNADYTLIPTRDEVAVLVRKGSEQLDKFVNQDDKTTAKAVLEWMGEPATEYNEYRNNLAVIANLGAVSTKNLGLLVSAPASWQKATNRSSMDVNSQSFESTHIGTVGEKLAGREVVFDRAPSYSTQYGEMFNVMMSDAETGSKLLWRTSSPLSFRQGQRYFVNGTIKAHSEFQDQKQTELTRVSCPDLKLLDSFRVTSEMDSKKVIKQIQKATDTNVVNSRHESMLARLSQYAAGGPLEEGETPWQPLAQTLLKAGADPLLSNKDLRQPMTPLDIALAYGYRNLELAEMYLEHLKDQGHDMASVTTLFANPVFYENEQKTAPAELSEIENLLKSYGVNSSPADTSRAQDTLEHVPQPSAGNAAASEHKAEVTPEQSIPMQEPASAEPPAITHHDERQPSLFDDDEEDEPEHTQQFTLRMG